jgi:hypothetical protein
LDEVKITEKEQCFLIQRNSIEIVLSNASSTKNEDILLANAQKSRQPKLVDDFFIHFKTRNFQIELLPAFVHRNLVCIGKNTTTVLTHDNL